MALLSNDSAHELNKLRTANDVAQRLLSGCLGVLSDSSDNPEQFDADFSSKKDMTPSEIQERVPVEDNGVNSDIWGASQYLSRPSSMDFARQHLEDTKAIITKSDALLRVSEPNSYETVHDSDFLTRKNETPWLKQEVLIWHRAGEHKIGDEAYFHNNDVLMKPTSEQGIVLFDCKEPRQWHLHDCDDSSQILALPESQSNFTSDLVKNSENLPKETFLTNLELRSEHANESEAKYDGNDGLRLLNTILQEIGDTENEKKIHDGTQHTIAHFMSETTAEKFQRQLAPKFDNHDQGKFKKGSVLVETEIVLPQVNHSNGVATQNCALEKVQIFDRITRDKGLDSPTSSDLNFTVSSHQFVTGQQRTLSPPDFSLDLRSLKESSICDSDMNDKPFSILNSPTQNPSSQSSLKMGKSRKLAKTSVMKPRSKLSNLFPRISDIVTKPIKIPGKPLSSKDFTSGWDMLPNEVILIIFSCLPQEDLKRISVVCHRFHNLSKDTCLWLKAEAVDTEITCEWLESFTRIQQLNITRCKVKELSVRHLRQFFQKCKDSLKQIHISQCTHKSLYGDNILLLATTHCRKLESISMPWSNTTDNGISALVTSNVALTGLDISGNCFISDSSLIPLLQRTGNSFRTLKLNGCFALTNDSLSAIAENCPDLAVLQIGLCPKVTSDCLMFVSKSLASLRELDLRGLKCVNDTCLDSISKNGKCLSKLVLSNCQLITDDGISNLAVELPGIIDLDLSGCPKITDIGCCSLANSLKGPSHLNLSSTSISHVSVSALTEHFYDSLESLKLSFCSNITHDCVEKLVSFCFKLQCLHIHGCKRLRIEELLQNQSSLEICR